MHPVARRGPNSDLISRACVRDWSHLRRPGNFRNDLGGAHWEPVPWGWPIDLRHDSRGTPVPSALQMALPHIFDSR